MQAVQPTLPSIRKFPRWPESLRDGSQILIRPLTRDDAAAERDFILGLSPQSRRFRFLGQIGHPSDALIERLTSIDFDHDVAFAAVERVGQAERIVGVSRYGTDTSGKRCECAVVVDDAWQGKGLGALLMMHLIDVAKARGIELMYSIDSVANVAMQDLARFLGFTRRTDPSDRSQFIHEMRLQAPAA
jgi:GNAT superfamily N-acetyltransferase